jgi:malonyl-CoA/methylmalonyl-CoA synthetase
MPDSPLLARWLARRSEDAVAVHDAGGPTRWGELVDASDRIAAGLLAGRASLDGERVALLVTPGAAFVASLFGVLRAGGAAVVLSPLHPPPEARYFCEDAAVHVVIASPDRRGTVAHLAPGRRIAGTDELLAGAGAGARGGAALVADPKPGDAALQLYTSGTTGKPKGAVLTHANVAVQQDLLREAWALRARDVLLHVLPLHHMHGLAIALLPALGAGMTTRFVAGPSFDAAAVWEAMAEATVFMAVPTIHAKLFAAFDDADAPTRDRWRASARALRLVTSGSAALPTRTGERWRDLTGEYPLERFGMTEIGVGLGNPLASEGRRPGTVGMPLPTVATRIVGDDGRDADRGELWVAGPSVFARYHGAPEATREAFVHARGRDWFRTGDTVERDGEGYVRVLGRTSVDILKSGGYKLSALEIEEVLREHDAVAEVAVVGLPDETWGERVVACVVPREGSDRLCAEEALRAFVRERLAPYKVPKQVVTLPELPRNALGKVVKPALIARLRGERPR